MDPSNFNGEAGRLIKIQTFLRDTEEIELYSFVPKELPKIEVFGRDISLMEKSNQANNALGELKGLTKNVGNLGLFIEPYVRKEAVVSSEIEGTFVSLTDVFLREAGSKRPESSNKEDLREVLNFTRAICRSIEELKNKEKIDKELLNAMHRTLLKDVKGARGRDSSPGEFRRVQNWIRTEGTPRDPDFVPPPEGEVERLMAYLFDYVNESGGLMRLIKAGLIHYYFETIHPYEDGNGRVGRTLILLYLIKSGVLEEPILYISPYLNKHRKDYYSLLMEVRQTGNYNEWIKFFLDGITETAINTSKKVRKMIDLYNDYKKRLSDARATPLSLKLLDAFFERPYWAVTPLQEKLGGETYPKTKRAMDYLVQCRIVKEFTSYKRYKIFFAPEIVEILDEDLI